MSGGWSVPESEIEFRFTASGGPGGQHANRSNTKVIAVWRPEESPRLPPGLRARVLERLGDVVRVAVDDERSQTRNREIAVERIRGRVANALVVERTAAEAAGLRGVVHDGQRTPVSGAPV